MSNPSAIKFEMQAPHGSRIMPTMTGIIIEFVESQRHAVGEWLQSEAVRFGQSTAKPSEMVSCPKCNGKMELKEGRPVFCTLCHGAHVVSITTAKGYIDSVEHNNQTVVRQQNFNEPLELPPNPIASPPPPGPHDQLRAVIARQQKQVAIPLAQTLPVVALENQAAAFVSVAPEASVERVYSTTTLITEEDEESFEAPKPGEPGFIGPIQQ